MLLAYVIWLRQMQYAIKYIQAARDHTHAHAHAHTYTYVYMVGYTMFSNLPAPILICLVILSHYFLSLSNLIR